jgi:hypothetical protein
MGKVEKLTYKMTSQNGPKFPYFGKIEYFAMAKPPTLHLGRLKNV